MYARTAVTLFVAPFILVGCSLSHGVLARPTVPDVERQVDEVLPVGSTRQDIEAWLTQHGIEHSFSDIPFLRSVTPTAPDGDYSGFVQGIIRQVGRTSLVDGSIQLLFVLDKDGRLKERRITWLGTGP